MANYNLAQVDKVEYILQNGSLSSITLTKEPDGWKTDHLKIVRHTEYHGIFTQFTEELKFYGEAKSYINSAYETDGINTNLYLIRRKLKYVDGDVKWVIEYIGLADFEELEEKDGYVSIRFNSNDLETLIKSHETDVFELEREDSIDGDAIRQINYNNRKVYLKGRTLITSGFQDVTDIFNSTEDKVYTTATIPNNKYCSVRSKIIKQGHPRHASVDTELFDPFDTLSYASSMFFVDDVAEGEDIEISIKWNVDATFWTYRPSDEIRVFLLRMEFNGGGYDEVERIEIHRTTQGSNQKRREQFSGSYSNTVNHKTGFLIIYDTFGGWDAFEYGKLEVYKHEIELNVKSFYDPTIHKFLFVDEVMGRLMEILTGEEDKFYSRLFGREQFRGGARGRQYLVPHIYPSTGEYGYIGMTSGYWLRNFDEKSDKYKPMMVNIKDTLKSLHAVFNTGVTVENENLRQRLRVEGLDYFYQDEVIIRLPYQVSDLTRKKDKDLFFSGTEIGYSEGGDYEDELGLDEPNTKTSTVTPLRRTENKFQKESKIRTDDYGLELTRRKPEIFFPEEDTDGDEHNWLLNLKPTDGQYYNQKDWQDELVEVPEGVLDPESYKGWLFTPMRMLIRHGWVLRAGMEQANNLAKYIKYINKNANKKLKTWFIGEAEPISEDQDILVNSLPRSKFLAETVKFKHAITDELMEQILGYTNTEYKGEIEKIPNVYFKIEFINEEGVKETGYLLSVDPKDGGSFELQLANENLIV